MCTVPYKKFDDMVELGEWIPIKYHDTQYDEIKLETGEVLYSPVMLVEGAGFLVCDIREYPKDVFFIDKDITHARKVNMSKIEDLKEFLSNNNFKVVLSEKLIIMFPEFRTFMPTNINK